MFRGRSKSNISSDLINLIIYQTSLEIYFCQYLNCTTFNLLVFRGLFAFLPALANASLAPDGKLECVPSSEAVSSFLTLLVIIPFFYVENNCSSYKRLTVIFVNNSVSILPTT